jgi:hypothetical protein
LDCGGLTPLWFDLSSSQNVLISDAAIATCPELAERTDGNGVLSLPSDSPDSSGAFPFSLEKEPMGAIHTFSPRKIIIGFPMLFQD